MDYTQIYADFLKTHIALKRPLKIVCDCSNGPTGMVLQKLINIPNLELIIINDNLDGDFPAHGPNPLVEGASDQASQKVLETGADFAVIFDADGDRAFFVDNKGQFMLSFMTTILLFKNREGGFVSDELVFQSLKHMKVFPEGTVHPSKVGSVFVKTKLQEIFGSTGAEFSGHYYFKDFFGADSGIFTMIQVANTVASLSSSISDFVATLPPQVLSNNEIKLGSLKWDEVQKKIESHYSGKNVGMTYLDGLTLDFGTTWLCIRPSNTEPILRVIGGSSNQEELDRIVEEVKALI